MDILQLPAGRETALGSDGTVSPFWRMPFDQRALLTYCRNNRNWRWHKKMQMWLTKDDVMIPQALGPSVERGYYIVWDTANWRKERVWPETSLRLCGRFTNDFGSES